jgi:hypothetical protein
LRGGYFRGCKVFLHQQASGDEMAKRPLKPRLRIRHKRQRLPPKSSYRNALARHSEYSTMALTRKRIPRGQFDSNPLGSIACDFLSDCIVPTVFRSTLPRDHRC